MSGVKRRRLPGLTVNRLIPNALTLLGLCAGMTAIRLALLERWDLAIAAVLVAMVADVLDGRIARLMGATSEFGAQLDSLADVINFGVTPALMVYLWALSGTGGLGWALILVFAMCCAMRLARFNA
ncbi:MAG: CDP-alcohol phosphatidyltransferase family protein, partial [Proteobacteria bacterium]|nr:CDP-alcohol phosphatidyltransferase family protein [Pseudomonadota bacterium]